MPRTRPAGQIRWSPRRREPLVEPRSFVPIRSSVDTVRRIIGQFEAGARIVVLYGASGSGRSTIAHRAGSLWPGPVELIESPPHRPDDAEVASLPFERRQRSRREPLRIVDALTLEHERWKPRLKDHAAHGCRLLVVGSTAWWLEHGRELSASVTGVVTKRLAHDEITHLINALRWMHDPKQPEADRTLVTKIAARSDGLLAEIVRMA